MRSGFGDLEFGAQGLLSLIQGVRSMAFEGFGVSGFRLE